MIWVCVKVRNGFHRIHYIQKHWCWWNILWLNVRFWGTLFETKTQYIYIYLFIYLYIIHVQTLSCIIHHVWINIYIYIQIYRYMHLYVYMERERESIRFHPYGLAIKHNRVGCSERRRPFWLWMDVSGGLLPRWWCFCIIRWVHFQDNADIHIACGISCLCQRTENRARKINVFGVPNETGFRSSGTVGVGWGGVGWGVITFFHLRSSCKLNTHSSFFLNFHMPRFCLGFPTRYRFSCKIQHAIVLLVISNTLSFFL